MPVLRSAYIGLGSNLGNGEENLKAAVTRLRAIDAIELKRVSSLYFSEPIGGPKQPWYSNAIVEVATSLAPHDMLHALQGVEESMGRRRAERNAPRIIDLDILFFGDLVIQTKDLNIPHPRLLERRFVLEPLVEISGELRHPSAGGTVEEWLRRLKDGGAVIKKGSFYGI